MFGVSFIILLSYSYVAVNVRLIVNVNVCTRDAYCVVSCGLVAGGDAVIITRVTMDCDMALVVNRCQSR